ncbi:mevalonate kinase [Candidatus Roizmanbacteria bacterium RIFCSPLOWO2_01_FULL_38_12]|uniref:mevalonate kinase n=1 Tax=Candidatus Roizmanbacteria bacterium RIFCSPLOWO2_01_FULL_38_12 TaxID=1802061 RepID=A0A1F7IYB0_9BACT|nr:MAG: mevalonate kinase [Candidatus Roizmanbacteria bacterium RIFCSPHIGHO2_01_FULL_38_15]OGK34523.1 MAG: mevalonate kinase [Candidatus Roizmanbacteria bacterium RIFCSPHIGHO2_12_FULL_38_13]OGK48352.1 MAG: mevalonate kinase [Candidatus Roizmanbacteria bacterium RIFCSPLOWO2_01_FULL_38_12]
MKITYSAPGKIILSGEHSVVYGKPAFVTAVNLRLTVTLQDRKPNIKDKKIHEAVMKIEEIIVKYLQKKTQLKRKPFSYEYKSDIPLGRGMGSSAAFCVATVAAVLHFYTGQEHDKQVINALAYQGEKYFHGMPSGVDVSASCFGGLIFYRKEFEFLKNISALNFKIPKKIQDHLVLIDSGQTIENTGQMVSHVGKRYNENPKLMETVLYNIEKITKRMVVSIVKEDVKMFADTLSQNQTELEHLGIVSKETKKILESLVPFGTGKVTGAGGISEGSGLILFYVKNRVGWEDYAVKRKLTLLPFEQDFKGVTHI